MNGPQSDRSRAQMNGVQQSDRRPRGRGRGRGRSRGRRPNSRPSHQQQPQRTERKSPGKEHQRPAEGILGQPQEEWPILDSTTEELEKLLRGKKFSISDIEGLVSLALATTKPEDHHRFIFLLVTRCHKLMERHRTPSRVPIEEAILKQLEKLYKQNQELYSEVNEGRPESTSLDILQFAAFANWKLRDLHLSLFGFNEMEREKLVRLVRQLMLAREYQTVCVCIAAFELQQSFDLEQVLLPVIILNIHNHGGLVEQYLRPHPKLQVEFTRILDALCMPGSKQIADKRELLDLPPDAERIPRRDLQKLILRLRKSFNIDLALLPNAARNQTVSALRYLVKEKYQLHAISDAAWEEVVSYTVNDDQYIQREFVKLLLLGRYYRAAHHWAEKFSLLQSFPNIDVASDQSSSSAGKQRAYHRLSIPESSIYLVSTADQLEDIARDIESCGVVGIDMEWRATYTLDQDPIHVSLVQLAIRTKVFLLDMVTLNEQVPERPALTKFFADLFASDVITKLGYDFSADIVKLQDSYPYLRESSKERNAFMDLKTVQANVEQRFPSLLKIDRDDKERPYRGLTELLVSCVGEPLDKTEQLSNWERRPLRQAQIMYAALDAFCLLEIHDFMDRSLSARDPPIKLRVLSSPPKKSDPKHSKSSRSPNPSRHKQHVRGPPAHGTPEGSANGSCDRSPDQADGEAASPPGNPESGNPKEEKESQSLTSDQTLHSSVEVKTPGGLNGGSGVSPEESHDMAHDVKEDLGGQPAALSGDSSKEGAAAVMNGAPEQNNIARREDVEPGRHLQQPGTTPAASPNFSPPLPQRRDASEILVVNNHPARELSPSQPHTVAHQGPPLGVNQSHGSGRGTHAAPAWQQRLPPEPQRNILHHPQQVTQGPPFSAPDKRRRNRLQGSGALGGARRPAAVPPHNPRMIPPAVQPPVPGILGDGPGMMGVQPGLGAGAFVFQDVEVSSPVEESMFLLETPGKHIISKTSKGESWVIYKPHFLSPNDADKYFGLLYGGLDWQQRTNKKKDGTTYLEPRQSVWFGEFPYTYSRVSWNHNNNWNKHLVQLRRTIEFNYKHQYNSVLCNLYRNGRDSIAWHSDDEYGLGDEPNIASMSLGDTRHFDMKIKEHVLQDEKSYLPFGKKLKVPVTHGSLLIMGGATQHDWLHSVPKEYHDKQPRINLTFRWIYQDNRDHQDST